MSLFNFLNYSYIIGPLSCIQYLVNKLKPLKYTCNHQLGNFVADIVFYGQDLNHIELIICLDY